jgi:hypothetical protein
MVWAKVIPLSGVHCTSILELYSKIIFFTMFSPSFHQVFTKCSARCHQVFTKFSPSFHQVFTKFSPSFHQVFTKFSPSFHQVFTKFSPSFHQIFTNCVGPGEFPFITILHSEDQHLLRLPHHRQLPVHHVWQSKHNKTSNYQTINHNCKHFFYNQIINYKNFNYNYNN